MAGVVNRKLFNELRSASPTSRDPKGPTEEKTFEVSGRVFSDRHPRSSKQASPMKRILACPRTTEISLQRIPIPLKKRRAGNVVAAASHGSSGCTLLCETTAADMMKPAVRIEQGLSEDTPIKFVLKWVLNSGVQNEMICTKLAEAYGMTAPLMQKVPPKVSSQFVKITKEANPRFHSDNFQLIAMNRVRGMNLLELCSRGEIFDLNQSSWEQMMKEFGKASIFDIFIGNFDRFVRSTRTDSGQFALDRNPTANPGNVLIHTTPQKKNLREVSYIDTGTIAKTPPKAEASSSKTEDESRASASGRSSPPTVAELHTFFTEIMSVDPQQLSRHISVALTSSLMHCLGEKLREERPDDLERVRQHILNADRALLEGLKEGAAKLRDGSFQQAALHLSEEATASLKNLIRENIRSISQTT